MNFHGNSQEAFNPRLAIYISIIPLLTLVSGYYGIEKKKPAFIVPLIISTVRIENALSLEKSGHVNNLTKNIL